MHVQIDLSQLWSQPFGVDIHSNLCLCLFPIGQTVVYVARGQLHGVESRQISQHQRHWIDLRLKHKWINRIWFDAAVVGATTNVWVTSTVMNRASLIASFTTTFKQ